MRHIKTFGLALACGLTFAATAHAQDTTSHTWHLAMFDDSGSMAWSQPPAADEMVVAFRVSEPQPFLNGTYGGMVVAVKLDCAKMQENLTSLQIYDEANTLVGAPPMGGQWSPIDTGGSAGPDDLFTAKCKGDTLPDVGTFTGDNTTTMAWLKSSIDKAAK